MKKRTLCILILCFSLQLTGQISTEFQQVIPGSPTAEEFKRQVDFPVGHYTGIPNISLDLFTTRLDNKEIGLSLSYLANGIQVDQRATWVGLGWSLNFGGAVVRNQRGKIDENSSNYDGYSTTNGPGSDLAYFLSLDSNSPTQMTPSELQFSENFRQFSATGQYDTEPDIFTFNALGISGKFIINFNGDIVSISQNDYKISGNAQTGFEVVDEFGYLYKFNAVETTMTTFRSSPSDTALESDTYNSSWFLTELISPNGNTITFSYVNELISYETPKTVSHSYYRTGYPNCNNTFRASTNYNTIDVTSKRLSRIDFPSGYILLNAINNRDDMPGAKRLDTIEIYDLQNNLINTYTLDYNYFGSGNNYNSKRLKLLKVNKVGASDVLSHTFSYESGILPAIGSYAKDYWGYYNGMNSNNSPIPNLTDGHYTVINPYNNASTSFQLHDDAHTNAVLAPSNTYIKAGILTSVTYPTGGKTSYEYELNHFNFRRNIPAVTGVGQNSGEEIFTKIARAVAATEPFLSDPQYDNDSYGDAVYGNTNERNVDFIAPANGMYRIYYVLEGTGEPVASGIRLLEGTQVLYTVQNGNYPLASNSYDITLTGGTMYTLNATVDDDNRRSVIMIGKLDYSEVLDINGAPIENSPVTGGLRIKEIRKYDANNELLLKRSYSYLMEDGQTSSGVVLNSDVPYISGMGSGLNCSESLRISSHPLLSYGSTKGSTVGYRRVTENFIDFDENTNYKNVYEFTSAYDFPSDDIEFFNQEGGNSDYNFAFPFTNKIENDFRRGLLKSKTSYNENNEVVYRNTYEYQYRIDALSSTIYGAHFAFNSEVSTADIAMMNSPNPYRLFVDYIRYSYDNIYRANRSSEVTTSYFDGNTLSTTTNYFYEKPTNSLLTKTEVINSRNQTLSTKIYYPDDVNDLSGFTAAEEAAIHSLTNQHRIAEVIQTEVKKDGVPISKTRAVFKDWGNNIILPDKIQTSKETQAIEEVLTYHSYDTKGNPIEVSKKDGTHIVYIWGYHQTVPIARIENATYDDVASYVSNLETLSDADDDRTIGILGNEGALRMALDDLRYVSALSEAQITTFTYDPLVGLTSVTYPGGNILYYHYDAFNRLEFVKDRGGKILSENQYHYKN